MIEIWRMQAILHVNEEELQTNVAERKVNLQCLVAKEMGMFSGIIEVTSHEVNEFCRNVKIPNALLTWLKTWNTLTFRNTSAARRNVSLIFIHRIISNQTSSIPDEIICFSYSWR